MEALVGILAAINIGALTYLAIIAVNPPPPPPRPRLEAPPSHVRRVR